MRPLGVDDLRRQVAIGQVALDPAGARVVYTRRTVVDERDRIDLWTVPVAGGAPRALTDGPASDTQPRWSPDGTRVAFLSARGDDPAQLHLAALDGGGEPRPLAPFPQGVADFAWTPDGALIVLADDDHPADPACEVIERIDWRDDGEGIAYRRPRHLHRLALDGAPERLTAGPWRAARPRVGPDGTVHFLADPRPGADRDPSPQVHRLEPGSPEPVAVTSLAGGVARYAIEPDGAIVCLGWDHPRPLDSDPPAAFRLAPGGALVRLAPALEHWAGQFGVQTDLHDWCTDLDDAGAITGISRDGCVVPHRVGEHGAEPLVDPAALPLSGAIAAAGGGAVVVAALTLGAGARAPDLHVLEPDGPRRLTGHGGAWLDEYDLPGVEVVELGPVRTILVHPPGAGREPRATVLCIHGGPTDQWAVVPPLEAVLLAGAGYRVVLPNIRGSTDRGAAWVAALGGDWGGADAADCHAVLDAVVADGLADPERLGCCGLSYGGFMVNWLIGTSGRFAAAVSENGVANQVAAWANCDYGPVFNRAAGLPDPTTPAGAATLWERSPLRHVASIATPLLMLQAADDLRCPAADTEQLYVALRWLGREVAHVRYPGEHHAFQGTGRFDRRVDRHRRMLAWFGRHMPAE